MNQVIPKESTPDQNINTTGSALVTDQFYQELLIDRENIRLGKAKTYSREEVKSVLEKELRSNNEE